jgi:hypothetical protein
MTGRSAVGGLAGSTAHRAVDHSGENLRGFRLLGSRMAGVDIVHGCQPVCAAGRAGGSPLNRASDRRHALVIERDRAVPIPPDHIAIARSPELRPFAGSKHVGLLASRNRAAVQKARCGFSSGLPNRASTAFACRLLIASVQGHCVPGSKDHHQLGFAATGAASGRTGVAPAT